MFNYASLQRGKKKHTQSTSNLSVLQNERWQAKANLSVLQNERWQAKAWMLTTETSCPSECHLEFISSG